jgi:hypothetical protein
MRARQPIELRPPLTCGLRQMARGGVPRTAFASEIPMHFAPILAAVIEVTWCCGLAAGGTMAISATFAVNYLLLQPKRS